MTGLACEFVRWIQVSRHVRSQDVTAARCHEVWLHLQVLLPKPHLWDLSQRFAMSRHQKQDPSSFEEGIQVWKLSLLEWLCRNLFERGLPRQNLPAWVRVWGNATSKGSVSWRGQCILGLAHGGVGAQPTQVDETVASWTWEHAIVDAAKEQSCQWHQYWFLDWI